MHEIDGLRIQSTTRTTRTSVAGRGSRALLDDCLRGCQALLVHTVSMAVSALSFDADQTLWDFRGVQQRALNQTVEAMIKRGDVEVGTVDAPKLQAVRDEVVREFRGQPHSLEEVRQKSFQLFLERAGHHSPMQAALELVEAFLAIRFESIKLYPEVQDSLERLKKTYKLALLSNGNTYPERCGLPHTFDAVVLGPAYGFEKPDRRSFEVVADQLGVELSTVVHVGDDWDDIAGANAVGAISVFMNREYADPEFRGDARYEVSDLVELESLLERL